MRRALLALLLVAILSAVGWALVRDDSGKRFYLGGVRVNEPDDEAWARTLAGAGFNTAEVTVYARQGDWDTANLSWNSEEPWVVHEIRAAKQQGLDVVLVLRVALDHAFERNKFLWHGMIMPRDEATLAEWFGRYRAFVGRWAAVAEAEGVDVLAVGSEMSSLTNTIPVAELPRLEEYWVNSDKVERERRRVVAQRERVEGRRLKVRGFDDYSSLEGFLGDRDAAHVAWALDVTQPGAPDALERFNARRRRLEAEWRRVVATARGVYGGAVTYAANFDQYDQVGFWDALDLISINAYFPLLLALPPDGADRLGMFRARWTERLTEIDALRRRQGIPGRRVLFTELGYTARVNATMQPWAAEGFSVVRTLNGDRLMLWEEQDPSHTERALAIRGLYEANLALGGDMLAGILYWKLSSEPAHADVEPFVLLLGERAAPDPMAGELERFLTELPGDRLRQRLVRRGQPVRPTQRLR